MINSQQIQDPSTQGTLGLKGLEGINRLKDRGIEIDTSIIDLARDYRGVSKAINLYTSPKQNIGFVGINDSMYDQNITSASQLDDLASTRGELQPWYAQLGAGIAKGISLGVTTFLDGTLGLVAGVTEGVGEYKRSKDVGESISKLWNNEISNSLKEWNEGLETILPNYRTNEEIENDWWKNLDTMNFWADGLLKNMGFTVGAFYSGGAWNKALKTLKLVNTGLGAQVTGSFLSAINEARVEANHSADDFLKLEYAQIEDYIRNKNRNYGIPDEYNAFVEEEELLKAEAKERANAMGLTTLIGNTVLLSLNNISTFGNLYSRGFKNAETIARDRIIKEGNKYLYKELGLKEAIGIGIKHGLVEGNEEMAQAFISETAGTLEKPDSPDSYYEALLDPSAELQTKDFIKAVTEGFVNTYGNGDRYEEFAIGALTGLIGIPTFGRVQNSDANTWLGKGKAIGISGGILGEINKAKKENIEGKEAVDYMNNYAQQVQNQMNYFVMGQSFTNAMDGYAEEEDAFEYKNAENNNDFAAISRFAQVGRLEDLRELVNQSFENISDEELTNIAEFTSPESEIGGWRNPDGSLMSESASGRKKMREELSKKKNKILSEIDKYESSIETVRAISNSSLNEDQINELAWLNWKVGMFTDRYKAIKEKNQRFLTELSQGIQNTSYLDIIDDTSEEGVQILKALNNTKKFIDALQSSNNPLQLAALIESNPKIIEFLGEFGYPIIEDVVGIDAATFEDSMNDLQDIAKIAKAARNFNQRYKEFKDNPLKLVQNREAIAKNKEKTSKATNNIHLKDKVDNSSVSTIVQGVEQGDLDISELDNLFSEEDNAFLNEAVQENTSGKQKVEEAKKIINTFDRANSEINNLENEGIDAQALNDARTLLKHNKEISESEQEMLDTATQGYNDPSLLYNEIDPSMQDISQEEIASVLDDRLDVAKSIIEQVKGIIIEQNEELSDLPAGKIVAVLKNEDTVDETKKAKATIDNTEDTEIKSTGHDATTKVVTENVRRKEVDDSTAKQEAKNKEQKKIADFFNEIEKTIAPENKGDFSKSLSNVTNSIDTLLFNDTPLREIGKIVKDTQSYKTLKQLVPTIDDYLNTYITYKKSKTASIPKKEEKTATTPVVTAEEVQKQTTMQLSSDPNKGELTSIYQYWKPTLSYLPFGKVYQKGDTTPFYIMAKTLKNANGTPMFTEAQLRRIEAVGKYLEEHGTFRLIDSGGVKAGDKVSFVIDNTLNDNAGEIVILMADSQGRIIGDVMSQNDTTFQRQAYLPAFVEKIVQEYKDAGSPQLFTASLTTVVDKNMVGKVPYLADHKEMNTLNAIHSDGNTPIPFLIGVAASSGSNIRVLASAGRTKRQGQSELERSINPPIVAKAGQPFLLMPTSSAINHYMPVPIMMDSYSPSTQGTALGQAIHKVLERVATADNSSAIGIIRDLEELISVQEIHINYSGDNVKVTIKPNGAEHQMTIYNGTKNAPNIVEQLELGLQGQSFQVSRKYMNEDYNGQDYNRMIGEVAKTNLPIGATHTVSDWFTLKPIDAAGNVTKAKSPRSIGKNPHAAELSVITLTRKGMQLQVNPKTWEVSDGKKTYEGQNADKARALAFGIYTNQNMEQTYDTEWGYYDPIKDEFVEKPNKVLRTLEVETMTSKQVKDKAKKAGLLNNKVREALWEVLSPEQQSIIANKKGPKQKQWMDALETAWTPTGFDESKLKGSVDDFLGRKGMYRRTDGSRSVWNREKELSWMKKALPNLSTEEHLTIIDGFIKIVDSKNPGYAYGKFQEGMITISDVAAEGTMYHEAFHAVVHTLLNGKEYQKLLDAAAERWSDLSGVALEEKLAEDFRMFMQSEEEWYDSLDKKNYGIIKRTLATLYHKLQNLIKELSGKTPYINKLYYSINRGKFSRRKVGHSDVTRFSEESYTYEMQSIKESAIASGSPTSNDIRYRYTDEVYELEQEIKSVDSDIQSIKDQRRLFTKNKAAIKWRTIDKKRYAQVDTMGYLYESEAINNIPSEYRDVVIPIGIYDGNTYRYYLYLKSKEESDKEIKELRDYQERLKQQLRKLKNNKWDVVSTEALQDQEEAHRRIEQYHRDKLLFDNLSQEDKSYLQERGISDIEYKDMTQLEREVLFKCKY